MTRETLIWLVIIIIITVLLLFYTYYANKRSGLANIFNTAVKQSAFTPTNFIIYDNSTDNFCDRLIIVQPFDWVLWAINGELYILNPEGGIKCGAGRTPAIRVFASQFIETCLTLNYDSLLETYSKKTIVKVPYNITSTRFTILSALNLLCEKWITFNSEGIEKHTRLTQLETPESVGRQLSTTEVQAIVNSSRKTTNYLHQQYLKHIHR